MSEKHPVAFAACSDYADIRSAIDQVLAPQLAMRGPVTGKSIMLKPNLLAWRKQQDPACVHPRFLVETAKAFLDAGAAKVAILENPAIQSVPSILHTMGIDDELRKLNVPFASLKDFAPMNPPENVRFKNLELASEYLGFDHVVNIAKAKTHGMMTLTLCVKNLFGLVNGSARLGWHLSVGRDFHQFADMLLDIYLTVKPDFNLLDGVIAMEGNGPGSGTPINCNFVAGATDSLALDTAVAPLLGVPDLLLLQCAQERNILTDFEIKTDVPQIPYLKLPDPPSLALEWGLRLPPFCRNFMRNHLLARPLLDPAKCVGCGLCARMCPPKAITMVDKKPQFSTEQCIRCFCCQEHCPKGAITPKQSKAMALVRAGEMLTRQLFRKK